MTVTVITFDEPDLVQGPISSITKDGVTIRFLRRVAIFSPNVATQSSPNALRNTSQDPSDETGFQKPILFEFSHLQRRVRVLVGLSEQDRSVPMVTARLIAYDASGRQIGSDSRSLGRGPTSVNIPLEVSASSDVIHRIMLQYDGNAEEVLDNLEFESSALTPIPLDTEAPIVTILAPGEGQQVNSRTVSVRGRIIEVNGISLVINGTPVPVRRIDANSYEFNAEITLSEGTYMIEARATDDAGNTGVDRKNVDMRLPARFQVTNVIFTQTGLLDSQTPFPTRRVAGKTSLFRLMLQIHTTDGRPTSVDTATITLERGVVNQISQGQLVPFDGQFRMRGNSPIMNGQQVYFFINGRWLEPGYLYRFVLRLSVRNQVIFEQTLVTDWSFRRIYGISMLLVPQHRPLDAGYIASLIKVLEHTARMFPVPDGVANLDSDEPGGIRFAILPPTSYRDHLDPSDTLTHIDRPISYEQGFLLHDHFVGVGPGRDTIRNTSDDDKAFWAGEYLPLNITFPEDANRNSEFDDQELEQLRPPPGPNPIGRRISNWSTFVRQNAESQRQSWNRDRALSRRRQAQRAIALITGDGTNPQNRTTWAGNAGAGERTFWANIDTTQSAFIPHETGHTFGFQHPDPAMPCALSGQAINLLTRQVIDPAFGVMCSILGSGSTNLFLRPSEYDQLFDRLVARGGQE